MTDEEQGAVDDLRKLLRCADDQRKNMRASFLNAKDDIAARDAIIIELRTEIAALRDERVKMSNDFAMSTALVTALEAAHVKSGEEFLALAKSFVAKDKEQTATLALVDERDATIAALEKQGDALEKQGAALALFADERAKETAVLRERDKLRGELPDALDLAVAKASSEVRCFTLRGIELESVRVAAVAQLEAALVAASARPVKVALPVVPATCRECPHASVVVCNRSLDYCTHGARNVGISKIARDEAPPDWCPLRSAT